MRVNYRYAVAWVALNDEPTCTDTETIAGFISTLLVADLFGLEPFTVAADIVTYRNQHG